MKSAIMYALTGITLLFFICVGWAFFSWLAEQLT